ncbi:PREDICTED: uncharacterized protein LOC107168895 [Diuraphis noxia]|uniref:uncharacterized protein LOC107168895 n=1 Tax=Diuraphis noxia TaxID=143948 RepID=UPI0007636E24|nr:PREDICTED: uncharacterized protein LOC107168895 [Diuraphis noxia]
MASKYEDLLCLAETQITAFWLMLYGRYDTMAYLRRVSYSVRRYIDMQIGPLTNEILLEDFIPGQLPTVGLQPLPPVLPPFHIRGAGRGRRGCGRHRAAAVPENHGMVRHPNVRQQPGGGNLGLIEGHHLLEQNTQPAHQAVDLDIPTFEGDPVEDRCFICLESCSQVNSANILVPCGHG